MGWAESQAHVRAVQPRAASVSTHIDKRELNSRSDMRSCLTRCVVSFRSSPRAGIDPLMKRLAGRRYIHRDPLTDPELRRITQIEFATAAEGEAEDADSNSEMIISEAEVENVQTELQEIKQKEEEGQNTAERSAAACSGRIAVASPPCLCFLTSLLLSPLPSFSFLSALSPRMIRLRELFTRGGAAMRKVKEGTAGVRELEELKSVRLGLSNEFRSYPAELQEQIRPSYNKIDAALGIVIDRLQMKLKGKDVTKVEPVEEIEGQRAARLTAESSHELLLISSIAAHSALSSLSCPASPLPQPSPLTLRPTSLTICCRC